MTEKAERKAVSAVLDRSAGRGTISLPRVLVGILVAWAVLDLTGRLGPIAWLNVIPELVAARRSGVNSPFTPNFTIRVSKWIGETALAGNLARTESRDPIVFSADELGFRLTPKVSESPELSRVLTGGASFAYGGGLSDDETFPAVLTRDEHIPTYNGGRYYWDVQHFIYVDRLLDRLQPRKPAAAIYLYWENFNPPLDARQLDPLPWRTDRLGRSVFRNSRYAELRDVFQNQTHKLAAALNVSPLEVLSIRLYKQIASGAILPNPYEPLVASRILPGGKRILFLQSELERVRKPLPDNIVNLQGIYFQEYARRLAARGIGLDVILLPNKYTLYGPYLDGKAGVSPNAFLSRMEAELTRRGLPVLNGLTVLQPYAASDVASGELSYFREDHHWSPKGVRRIAAAYGAFARGLHQAAH